MNPDRARATQRLMQVVTAARKRGELPASNLDRGHPSNTVVALESDLVETFMNRVASYDPPVRAAVYYPESDRLALVTLEPGDPTEDAITLSPATTVGMMVDAAQQMKLPGRWDEVLKLTREELAGA